MMRVYKSEADVKKYVRQILEKYRWKSWMPAANGYGETGISDFCGLRAGVFLAVETKFGDNELTVNQERFLNEVLAEDGFGFVVYEWGVETFEKWSALFDTATTYTSKGEKVPDNVGAELLECIRILTEPIALAAQRRAARSAKRKTKIDKKFKETVDGQ